ncbi:uncharacterized protein E0L32_000990 [Thyridium curvatum]|uniref:Ubiquitin carboxyl-terminal hydrolase 19 n=1 Tax=Thyridium curvatum TaxID=1093900 RepID=A0A507AMS4_9PEZI|nr:uncharacterized protein E0L32_000990 [Thyridium curvatum]TPX11172.1 hypothetical protein E0L32_000990 [Thyridium curvatum]
MDPRFTVNRDEFHNVQMDLKQLHLSQSALSERLQRLEKRQYEESTTKSIWGANSPFPSALSGTPLHGPIHMPPNDDFDDFDAQSQNLLGSLHLEPEDEPIRRGAASRANSVRFDEAALQGVSSAHRQSGDFGPIRPGSGFGMMERSLSHKSDGRHSSAGHSVHSVHSLASRGSSLGLDTHFLVGSHEDDSPLDIPEPPPSLFVLGSVPAIIRCWLTNNFAHGALLYAAVCSGSQKSTLDYSLVKELELEHEMHRDLDGTHRVRLPVYLAEAIVAHSHSRSPNLMPQIPSMTANFEVMGFDQTENAGAKSSIHIFIGSDTLRAHSADLLFSQNTMNLYGNDRDKLTVPFVRPEDDALFKNLTTSNIVRQKPKLNGSAPEFVSSDAKSFPEPTEMALNRHSPRHEEDEAEQQEPAPLTGEDRPEPSVKWSTNISESGGESEKPPRHSISSEQSTREAPPAGAVESARRDSSIWSSWRQGTSASGSDGGQRESGPLSGYQPAARSRNMKVLKPQKSGSSMSARTGAAYEPAPAPRTSGEHRRKTPGGGGGERDNGGGGGGGSSFIRWDSKRSVSSSVLSSSGSGGGRDKTQASNNGDPRGAPPRAANPVGGASAFSWMNPSKSKASAASAE